MHFEDVEFASDGRPFGGLFIRPAGLPTPLPGVMVLHGGAGIGAHERERGRMLAQLGHTVFVPDLFGEPFTSRAHGVEVITRLVEDPPTLRARLRDARDRMCASPSVDATRVAAIGFCFGGHAALELARSGADVRAVVSFHGALRARAPAEPGVVKASVLVCTGAADPFAPRSDRDAFEEEMTHAKADWQLHVYGGAMHGFTERAAARPGLAYDEAADRRSWSAMQALLDAALGR